MREIRIVLSRHRTEVCLAKLLLFLAANKNIVLSRAESLVIKYFTPSAYLSTYLATNSHLHPQSHFQSFTQDEDNTGKT